MASFVSPNQIQIQIGLVLLVRPDTHDDTSQPCRWRIGNGTEQEIKWEDMPSLTKQLRKAPSRLFNRIRNRSSGSDGPKVVSLIKMLVTRSDSGGAPEAEAAAAWVAGEEEILSEQGGNSIEFYLDWVLAWNWLEIWLENGLSFGLKMAWVLTWKWLEIPFWFCEMS